MLRERSFAPVIAALVLLPVGLPATTASAAARVRPFDAQFQDFPCGSPRAGELRLCGTGRIGHFGPVTSKLVLRHRAGGPAPGCMTYTGTRTVTLAGDKGRLRLSVTGPACGSRAWGTFTIVGGTGVFSHARGEGVIWGTPLRLRYFGVLTLAR